MHNWSMGIVVGIAGLLAIGIAVFIRQIGTLTDIAPAFLGLGVILILATTSQLLRKA